VDSISTCAYAVIGFLSKQIYSDQCMDCLLLHEQTESSSCFWLDVG